MRQVVDAPVYPGEGFKKPRLVQPACIRDSLQLPRDLRLVQGETVTVRFAVGLDGGASEFSVLGNPTDSRIGGAIWSAVQRCRFVPGSDTRGNPVAVWLVMPFRFGDS
jgi:protein TonB